MSPIVARKIRASQSPKFIKHQPAYQRFSSANQMIAQYSGEHSRLHAPCVSQQEQRKKKKPTNFKLGIDSSVTYDAVPPPPQPGQD